MSRKRQRDPADVLPTTSGEPRILNVVEFANARSQELQSMTQAVSTIAGNRRAFQTVPRYLRRRAMSHNIYRIPVRLRKQAKREMEQSGEPTGSTTKKKHRKSKRRPEYLLRDYERRQREFIWLETHIWHAKRMHMGNLWGYKIALHLNDKSARMCYHSSIEFCTMHDASHYGVIEVKGSQATLSSLLESISPQSSSSLLSSPSHLRGTQAGQLMLYHSDSFPYGAIAPIDLIWNPVLDRTNNSTLRWMWIWIHPAAFAEGLEAITTASKKQNEAIEINSRKDEILRFQMTGAKSLAVLQTTFHLTQDSQLRNEAVEQVWKTLACAPQKESEIPVGGVIALTLEDPRLHFPPESVKRRLKRMQEANKMSESSTQEMMVQTNLSEWPENLAVGTLQLWSEEVRKELKNKGQKQVYRKARKRRNVKEQKRESEEKSSVNMEVDEGTQETKDVRGVPVILVKREGGWDVVIPAGWGMSFWKSFIYAGAWATGQREHNAVFAERGRPIFPDDYADTAAYEKYSEQRKQEANAKYYARPPAKRVNYSKLGVPHPFEADWKGLLGLEERESGGQKGVQKYWVARGEIARELQNKTLSDALPKQTGLACVRVLVVGPGVPEWSAMVYQPTEEDEKVIASGVQRKDKATFVGERELIGRITTGGYSYPQGCGLAVGCMTVKSLLCLSSGSVLLRNTNSPRYFVGKVHIIE